MSKMIPYNYKKSITHTYRPEIGNREASNRSASLLMTSTLEPPATQQIQSNTRKQERSNPNESSQFTKYQNLAQGYEEYVNSLKETAGLSNIDNNTPTIETKNVTGEVIQLQIINFQEFVTIANSQQSLDAKKWQKLPLSKWRKLPMLEDYIDQYNQKAPQQQSAARAASTSLDQDSLLNEGEEKGDNNEEPIAGQGDLNESEENDVEEEKSVKSSNDEEEINSSLTQSQILNSSLGASIIGKLRKSKETLKNSNSSQSDPNLSPQPLSQSLLASFVAPERINLANSQLLKSSLNQDDDGSLEEVKKNCKTILDKISTIQTEESCYIHHPILEKVLGNKNFSDTATLESSESSQPTEPVISKDQALFFKKVLAEYVINNFPNILKSETSKYSTEQDISLLAHYPSEELIILHPKVAITLFELCFPDANIVASWAQFASDKIMLDLWQKLNEEKNQDLTLTDFCQEYFPGYTIQEENKYDKLNTLLQKQETSAIEESSKEESEKQEEPSEEESESSNNKKNEEILKRFLTIINNPIFTERLQPFDNPLAESDNGATPIKSALSAAEAISFVQFLCLVHINEPGVSTPQNWEQILQTENSITENSINDEELKEIVNDKKGIEEFSKAILLHNPKDIIEIIYNFFPNDNIIESWHLLFPHFSIEQLWQTDAFKNLTLKKFWKAIAPGRHFIQKDVAQEYKDLAMLKSATKSGIVNTGNQLKQSTCDNLLGISQLPDTEELKETFEAALNQAANTELAQKILQYNYPDENSSNDAGENQKNEETVLSQEEAQFFRKFVCDMINSNNNADQVVLKHPRDVVQWFGMCFPNVHLPKAWEVIFPDTSIMTLWKNNNQLAANTLSKFCAIVFPEYELSEDSLDPAQKQNFDLFLNYGPKDQFDITKENLSVCLDNLCAETKNSDTPIPNKADIDESSSNDESESKEKEKTDVENSNLILYYAALNTPTTSEVPSNSPIYSEKKSDIDESSSNDESESKEEEKTDVENSNLILYYAALNTPTTSEAPSNSPIYSEKKSDIDEPSSNDESESKEEETENTSAIAEVPNFISQEKGVGTIPSSTGLSSHINRLDEAQKSEKVVTLEEITSNIQPNNTPATYEVGTPLEQPASKSFFWAFFDSVSGLTSSLLSSIGSIFRSTNSTTPETNSGGAENDDSSDDFTSLFGRIFSSMFESIGSFLGISGGPDDNSQETGGDFSTTCLGANTAEHLKD